MNNILILFLSILLWGCGSSESSSTEEEWIIPVEEVLDGGPGKDGIPSVDDPNFSSVTEIGFLDPSSLVIGVIHDGVAKAYPHNILDWHEIVNDNIADLNYALTYCPLTGTGIGWNSSIGGDITTFGVSGKLYNTNLMPYDRDSDSYWSQIQLECVTGNRIGTKISTIPVIETTWASWQKAYPNSLVMNTETGFSRNYSNYPYGDYRTNHDNIIFPVTNLDTRLPAKERVLTVVEGNNAKVYSIELFDENTVIEDNFSGKDLLIVGSKSDNYIVAFENPDGQFSAVQDQLPIVAVDQEGNNLNIDGTISGGPRQNDKLAATNSFMAYYFSLGSFYEVEVYE